MKRIRGCPWLQKFMGPIGGFGGFRDPAGSPGGKIRSSHFANWKVTMFTGWWYTYPSEK